MFVFNKIKKYFSPQEKNKRLVEKTHLKDKIEYITKVHWKMYDFEMFSHIIKRFNLDNGMNCTVFCCQHGVEIAKYFDKKNLFYIIFVNDEQFYVYHVYEYSYYKCFESQIPQFHEIMNNCYYDAQMWDGEIEKYNKGLKQEALNKSLNEKNSLN
jgi:hypothetical protein